MRCTRQVFSLEPFDEHEEHALKCMHYGVSLAVATRDGPLSVAQWTRALVPCGVHSSTSSSRSAATAAPLDDTGPWVLRSMRDGGGTLAQSPPHPRAHMATQQTGIARRWNHAACVVMGADVAPGVHATPRVFCFGGYGGVRDFVCVLLCWL